MSIKPKGKDQWLICIYKGKVGGQSQYHHEYFKGTKQEAEIEEARVKGEFGTIQSSGGTDPTVEEFMIRWLADYIKPFNAPSTLKLYEMFTRNRIIPEIGKFKLKNLNAMHVQRMFRKMVTERKDGQAKPVSAGTINGLNRVLKSAMQQAVREGLIRDNPCMLAKPPSLERFEPAIIDTNYIHHFLEAAKKSDYYALIETALMTGLRLGELLALTWKDVNLANGIITVNKALKGSGTSAYVDQPKTRSGYRTVMIPMHTVETLKRHKENQDIIKAAEEYKDMGIVFASKTGSYANGHNITKRTIKSICKKAGLPPMRFHDLRHTHGSLLAANSLSARAISDRLGHADASFTMRAYTHKTSLSQLAVVNVLDSFFTDNVGK